MTSRFLNQLIATPAGRTSGRTTWILRAVLSFYYAPAKEKIHVPEGFITDFASIPRLPLMWWLMSDYGHPAAVVHDYLCERRSHPRKFADEVFYAALLAAGVPRWRASLMYSAVRSYAVARGL